MPKYKLTYFNLRGYAEICRMLFALADQEYEDIRITSEEWVKIKPTTPFNQLPILEVDDFKMCQSSAMYRYLARTFGLTGKTLLEEARGDMIVECIRDTVRGIKTLRLSSDEDYKAETRNKFTTDLPDHAEKLNDFLGNNNFFLGDSITWVDIVFYNFVWFFQPYGLEFPFDKFPKLKDLQERVENHPKIAAWIAKRPVTAY